MSWIISSFLFIVRLLLVGVSLGVAAVRAGLLTQFKPLLIFCAGFSCAVFGTTFSTFLFGLLPLRLPEWFLWLFPCAVAVVFLFCPKSRNVMRELWSEFAEKVHSFFTNLKIKRSPLSLLALLGLILCLVMCARFCLTFLNAEKASLYESDRAHYETQAKLFAGSQDALEIDNYQGEKAGMVNSDYHGPLWPIYIADAWFSQGENASKWYMYPQVIDTAYIMVFLLFIVSVAVLAYTVCRRMLGVYLAVLLTFSHRMWWLMVFGSRDAFRLTALIVFMLAFMELVLRLIRAPNGEPFKLRARDMVFLFFASYFSMEGHAGNVFLMLGMCLVFAVLAVCFKMSAKNLFAVGSSVLAGTLLGAQKVIRIFLSGGMYKNYESSILAGTVMGDTMMEQRTAGRSFNTLLASFTKGDYVLMIFGMVCFVFSLTIFIKNIKAWRQGKEVSLLRWTSGIFSAFSFGMLLLFTGLFNLPGYNTAYIFIEQIRYRVYIFLLAGVLISACFCLVMQKAKGKKWHAVPAFFVFFLCGLLSIYSVHIYWPVNNMQVNAKANVLMEAASHSEKYIEEGRIYVTSEIAGYYYVIPPQLLVHNNAAALLHATTPTQVEEAIRQLDAKVFAVDNITSYSFEDTALLEYLMLPQNAEHYQFAESADSGAVIIDVFVVKEK